MVKHHPSFRASRGSDLHQDYKAPQGSLTSPLPSAGFFLPLHSGWSQQHFLRNFQDTNFHLRVCILGNSNYNRRRKKKGQDMGQCCQGSEKNKEALKPARRTAESTNVISFFDSRRETLFQNEQYNHKNSNPMLSVYLWTWQSKRILWGIPILAPVILKIKLLGRGSAKCQNGCCLEIGPFILLRHLLSQ